MAKNPEGISEVVNDLHRDLTQFWAVLQDETHFGMFRRRAEATPFSEDAWRQAVAGLNTRRGGLESWERAWCFFVCCRQSLAGRMDGFAPLSRTRTRRGMNEQASAWLSAVEGLPRVHARLKRVVILNRPALEVIRSQDGPATLFYLDPPYLHSTRATTREYGAFEMTTADHAELLDLLDTLRGKFMLSGYGSDLYNGFADAHGWRRLDFVLPNNAAAGETKRSMTECIWVNY